MTSHAPTEAPSRRKLEHRRRARTMKMQLWIRFDDRWRQYLYDHKDRDSLIRDAVNAIKAGYVIQVIP